MKKLTEMKKETLREQLARDIEKFLQEGNQITQLPQGRAAK